jgi:hypothetical protein
MASSGILGLLFEISADPSKAQQALASFEASTGAQLQRLAGKANDATLEATRFGQVLAQAEAQEAAGAEKAAAGHTRAAQAVKQHSDAVTVLAPKLPPYDQQLQGIADTLTATLVPGYEASSEAAGSFGEVVVDSFARATDASHQATAAEAERLVATLGFRREAAAIEAVWETAKGFAALGDFDFWAAAQHFMAAAEYGIIAGTSPGGGGAAASRGGALAAGRTVTAGSPAGAGSPPAGGQGQVVNVYVEGMISPDNLRQVIGQINQQVKNKGTVLVSTTSLQPATVRGLR